MAVLRYILPILLTSVLAGCYEDFNPEIDTKPVLCLNSLITDGEPIKVDVTHTWMFNDEKAYKSHNVTDATVTILANKSIVGSDYLPEEGDEIRIVVESPTYGTATAAVTVPFATSVGNVKVSPVVTSMWKGSGEVLPYEMLADVTFNLNIQMEVNDPAGTDNYYLFGYNCFSPSSNENPEYELQYYDASVFSLGKFEYNSEPIFKEHIGVIEAVMGNDDVAEFTFFTDRQFSGTTYTLHLNFSNNVFRVKSKDIDKSLLECGVNLYIAAVTQSYYNWAVYKWNADEGISEDLSNMGMAEPKWGYSNVSTGAGVVAAQSTSKFTIDLKDFLNTTLNYK